MWKLWCKCWKPSFKATLLIIFIKSFSLHLSFLCTLHPASKHLFFCEKLFRHSVYFRILHQCQSPQYWSLDQLDVVVLISLDSEKEGWYYQQQSLFCISSLIPCHPMFLFWDALEHTLSFTSAYISLQSQQVTAMQHNYYIQPLLAVLMLYLSIFYLLQQRMLQPFVNLVSLSLLVLLWDFKWSEPDWVSLT